MTTTTNPANVRSQPARWAPAFFVASTALGVVMRLLQVGMTPPLPFDHLLHAHSHALYFGWAGLIILTAITSAAQQPLIKWMAGLVVVMGTAFLVGGYAPGSIAASAAVMSIWYVVMWRERRSADRDSRILYGYVVLASLGIVVLGPVSALDGPPFLARLAVHGFLSTFSWFFVLGTVVLLGRGGLLDSAEARRIIAGIAAFAWLTFPVGVIGGPEIPGLGPVSRVAATALAYPGYLLVASLWRRAKCDTHRRALRMAAAWFTLSVGGLVAVAIGGSAVLSAAGRHGIVFYLHALLLGYVSTIAIWWLARQRGTSLVGLLDAHGAGVGVMLAGLGLAAASPLGRLGLWLAALGAAITWAASLAWARKLWTGHPSRESVP